MLNLPTSERREHAAMQLRTYCAFCEKPVGSRPRVVAGLGMRTVCASCEARLYDMGHNVMIDRRLS